VVPRATVRWNEAKQRWMAWVRFPDGSRRKVERIEKADAEADLNELLALRAAGGELVPRRQRPASFNEVLDEWLEAGCPSAAPGGRTRHARQEAASTIDNARRLLATHIRPGIGVLWVNGAYVRASSWRAGRSALAVHRHRRRGAGHRDRREVPGGSVKSTWARPVPKRSGPAGGLACIPCLLLPSNGIGRT
jgi:hypothetical protein